MWRHGFIRGLLLCTSVSLLAEALLEPADPKSYPRSAEIGQCGLVVYEVFQRGGPPDHICFHSDYNCTTPHGQCSDNHDKYQLVIVAEPVSNGAGHTWFCGIQIEDVSFNDVGVYKICKLIGGAQTIHGCVEHQNLHINFAVWERDSHGRICQTSYDETSQELVNNCSSLTTTPQLTTTEEKETAPLTTKAVESSPVHSINYTEKKGNNDANKNEKPEHPGECYSRRDIILTAVGVLIAVLAVVAVIWTIRKVRKRRQRSKFDDHECYLPGHPMGPSRPVVDNVYAVPGDSEEDDSTGDAIA